MDDMLKKIECHCGISSFHVKFDKKHLPYHVLFCHCNTCRHSTGQMAFYGIPINGPPLVGSLRDSLRPVNLDSNDLTGYSVCPASIHYFCFNCSARMFLRRSNNDKVEWLVAGGLLESTKGIMELEGHINIADTMDGGLSDQIRTINGKTLRRHAGDEFSEELPVGWRSKALKPKEKAMADDTLHARCQCGAIRILITRPNELSAAIHAPYPALLHPHHCRLSLRRNPKEEKWWLRPSMRRTEAGHLVKTDGDDEDFTVPCKGTKYLAGHCVCLHCRLGSGFDIQTYAFFPRTNIFEEGSEEPIEFYHEEYRPRGLKQYSSSPGKYREFCATCGATAFYWHIARPDVINMATGLIDERDDGVRAEEWLSWHKDRVAFMEEGLAEPNKELVMALLDGIKDVKEDKMAPAAA